MIGNVGDVGDSRNTVILGCTILHEGMEKSFVCAIAYATGAYEM